MNELDQTPRARQSGLLEREVDRDLVVYDLKADDAHLLNETTAAVYRMCDGRTPVAQIAAKLDGSHGEKAGELLAWQAISELSRAKLLDGEVAIPSANGMTRRSLMKKIGIGVLAIPVISTIAASPAAAQVTGATCAAGSCSGSATNCQPTGGPGGCGQATSSGCTCAGRGTPAVCTCA